MSQGSNSSRITMARSSSKWIDEYERGQIRNGNPKSKKTVQGQSKQALRNQRQERQERIM